jgi:hypothetical protein
VAKNRRKVRPWELAHRDPTRAARLGVSDPHTAVISVVVIDRGEYQCCWRRGPAPGLDKSSPQRQPGSVHHHRCLDEARFMIIHFRGETLKHRLPVCTRHKVDVLAMFHRVVTAAGYSYGTTQ